MNIFGLIKLKELVDIMTGGKMLLEIYLIENKYDIHEIEHFCRKEYENKEE